MKGRSIRRATIMLLCVIAIVVVCFGVSAGTGADVEAAFPSIIGPLATIDPAIWGEILDLGIIVEPDDPVVEDVEPNGGLTTGGDEVVITGLHFTGATEVSFGGTLVPEDDFDVISDTEIHAIAPIHAPGTVQVKVVTSAGESPDTSADDYTYIAAPTTTAAPTTAPPTTAPPTTAPPVTAAPTETTAEVTTTVGAETEGSGLSGGWIAFIVVIAVVVIGGMGAFVYRMGKGSSKGGPGGPGNPPPPSPRGGRGGGWE